MVPSEFEISPGHFPKEMSKEEIDQTVLGFSISTKKYM